MEETLIRYKNRLVDLSTRNRALVLKKLYNKRSFDIKILDDFYKDKSIKLLDFILKRSKSNFKLLESPYIDKFTNQEKEKIIVLSSKLKNLNSEIELVEKEKGSYDLYIGYLFVEGQFLDKTFVRAPLLLFPVKIQELEGEWVLTNNVEENIQINKIFVMAFQQYNQVKINDFELEFEEPPESFSTKWLIKYLSDNQIRINNENDNKIISKFKDYTSKDTPKYNQGELILKNHIILGQFPVSNSSLNEDYKKLLDNIPKNGLVHDLLQNEKNEKDYQKTNIDSLDEKNIIIEENKAFFLTDTDLSQEKAVFLSKKNNQLVIYGPPGTGKSQVIVNLIADNLANNKKVLMVSQKRAALDVVYNRLAQFGLHERVGFVHDYNKDWSSIFKKVQDVLEEQNRYYETNAPKRFIESADEIELNIKKLEQIAELLHKKNSFGLTLFMLYSKSKNDTTKYIDLLFQNFSTFDNINNKELNKMVDNIDNIVNLIKFDFKNYLLSERNSFSNFPEIEKNKITKILDEFLSFQKIFKDREKGFILSLNEAYNTLNEISDYFESSKNIITNFIDTSKKDSCNLISDIKVMLNNIKDKLTNELNLSYKTAINNTNVSCLILTNKKGAIKNSLINELIHKVENVTDKFIKTFSFFKKIIFSESNLLSNKLNAVEIYINENISSIYDPSGFLPEKNYQDLDMLVKLWNELKHLKVYNLKYWKNYFEIKKNVKNHSIKEIFSKLEHTLEIKIFIDKLNNEFKEIELSYIDNNDSFLKKIKTIKTEVLVLQEQKDRILNFQKSSDYNYLNKETEAYIPLNGKIFNFLPTFNVLENNLNILSTFNKIILLLTKFLNSLELYKKDYDFFDEALKNIINTNCNELVKLTKQLNDVFKFNNKNFSSFLSFELIEDVNNFIKTIQESYSETKVNNSIININLDYLIELDKLIKTNEENNHIKDTINNFNTNMLELINTSNKNSILTLNESIELSKKRNDLIELVNLIKFEYPACEIIINKCFYNIDKLNNFVEFGSISNLFEKNIEDLKISSPEITNSLKKNNLLSSSDISHLIEKEKVLLELLNIILYQIPNFNIINNYCIEKTNNFISFLSFFSDGSLKKNLESDPFFLSRSFDDKFKEFEYYFSKFIKLFENKVINDIDINFLIEKEKNLESHFVMIKENMMFNKNLILMLDEKLSYYFKQKAIKFFKNTFLKEEDKFFEFFKKIQNEITENFSSIKTLDQLKSDLDKNEKKLINFCLETFGENELELKKAKGALINTFYLKHIDNIESENQKILQNLSNEADLRNLTSKALTRKKKLNLNFIIDLLNRVIDDSKSYNRLGNDTTYKDIKYEASKKRKRMTLRKYVSEFHSKGLFNILPCWLVTPEVASAIFPFNKDLFDIVIFDEASQMFVEQGIPSLYRAKKVVIAGDDKQLQPNDLYQVKIEEDREKVDDEEYQDDSNLEVKSLLDLAKVKYKSSTLTYHYRALFEELINFSNYAFYNGKIQITPNREKSSNHNPIERIKVDGRWIDRKNEEEAKEIVILVKKILMTRENNETIGVITFNSTQKDLISELLDYEVQNDIGFREVYSKEINRRNGDEDISLFIKNIENVQGDERDIIIFSIGYAKNDQGKIVTRFGSLNQEGGENRLNVAISRAKRKIYLITSIEPEDINVDNSKNIGPKLFKKYLQYARAVSDNNNDEVKSLLNSVLNKTKTSFNNIEFDSDFENQVYDELINLGYEVHTQVGASGYRIDLAIYDRKKSAYILGIECDGAMYHSSKSARERDIYRQKFLESRGWKIHRIWSRNWWKNSRSEINKIEFILNSHKNRSKTT